MGCGDWNDGMNLVGEHGKGESVWLAFFLYDVLMQFAELARLRGDAVVRRALPARSERLRRNIEQHGWDGEWYRRAYFDDGTPLGSASNRRMPDRFDCAKLVRSLRGRRCHAIASWRWTPSIGASCAATHALIQLFDPPFDKSDLNPGYIKGYVPGREGKRRAVHACARSGPSWHSPPWATAHAPGNYSR